MYVTHTTVKKKIEELFTLSSELPFLADLVFWLYYIVLQFALLFLFIKILQYMYVTVQSVIERKSHWQKLHQRVREGGREYNQHILEQKLSSIC